MINIKKILLFIFLLFFTYLERPVFGEEDLINKIESTFFGDWEIDKKIVNELTFNLTRDPALLAGDSEKYILRDTNGLKQLWLFKISNPINLIIEESVSKLGKLCGLNLPYVHRITLPINNTLVNGTIQKILSISGPINKINNLNHSQLNELQKQFILDYFVSNHDFQKKHFLIEKDTKNLYGVDKDDSFCFKCEPSDDMKLAQISNNELESLAWEAYGELWHSYINNEIEINLTKGLFLANFIKALNNTTLYKLFKPLFDAQIISFNDVISKKNKLPEDISSFYKLISKNKKDSFSEIIQPGLLINYKVDLFKKITQETIGEKTLLKKLKKAHYHKHKQKNIEIITSSTAKAILIDNIIDPILIKKNSFNNIEWKLICTELYKLRNNSQNIMEKLALSLYILSINELFLNKILWTDRDNLYQQMFVTINPDFLDIEYIKKRYLSILKEKESLVDIKGEWYYAMTLAYIIKGEKKFAYQYMLKAIKHGFKIDAIVKKILN